MDGHELIFTGGCECKTRLDILPGELGEIGENLLHAHAGGEVGEHIRHGDAHSPDAWFATPFPWFDGKDFGVIHQRNLLQKCLGGELFFRPPIAEIAVGRCRSSSVTSGIRARRTRWWQ
jgi:hypothetical protein